MINTNSKNEIPSNKSIVFYLYYEYDNKAFEYFSNYFYGDLKKRLGNNKVEIYTINASLLNAIKKIIKSKKEFAVLLGSKSINIWETLSITINSLENINHSLPTTSRALRTQVNNYIKNGYDSIISKKLQNTNASKIRDNQQIALIDELLSQHQNFDNSQIAKIYNVIANKMNWHTITNQTIANRKKEIKLIITAGRKGTSVLSNTLLMQNKRVSPTKPMLYWTIDGWDAELLYQSPSINKKGYSTTTYHNRLNIVIVLDTFNKYPVGYAIGTHETPELIKEALRNAFHHTKELFNDFYKPYQLQSDNYARASLNSIYQACCVHYTPAKVKNSKSKVIEPYFNRFNKEYCQIYPNWSGHNINSGSKNQPNVEYLNRIRNQFPDKEGCKMQLISAIEQERFLKRNEYISEWSNVPSEYLSKLTLEMYLKVLGKTTGYTNRLTGAGLITKILGRELCYDSYDLDFRKLSHIDWCVKYDNADLSKILVVNSNSKNSKLIQEIGTYQFILEQKHIQPMALAERTEGDAFHLKNVVDYNNEILKHISKEREKNAIQIENLFQRPELNNTLAKLLLLDSKGQHKNIKNQNNVVIEAQKITNNQSKVENLKKIELKEIQLKELNEYNKSKIDLNDYL